MIINLQLTLACHLAAIHLHGWLIMGLQLPLGLNVNKEHLWRNYVLFTLSYFGCVSSLYSYACSIFTLRGLTGAKSSAGFLTQNPNIFFAATLSTASGVQVFFLHRSTHTENSPRAKIPWRADASRLASSMDMYGANRQTEGRESGPRMG